MHITKHTKGYSLVEVLVAIAILLLALVGPMTIAAKGIQSASYVREQTTALYLAQEGLEAFTSMRNSASNLALSSSNPASAWDWASISALDECKAANGCNLDFEDSTPVDSIIPCTNAVGAGCELYFTEGNTRARYSLDSGGGAVATPYTRVIKITDITDGMEVESTVYWSTRLFGATPQSVTLTTLLLNLYE